MNIFKRWRFSLGLSQSQAAETLGIHVQTVKKYEAGEIELRKIVRLAMAAVSHELEEV
ncbi:MAG: helix-turn-helix domain-containing protein [Gammaproteobacteria bacterium]